MKNTAYNQKYCTLCRNIGVESIGYLDIENCVYCVECWIVNCLVAYYNQYSPNTDEAKRAAYKDLQQIQAINHSKTLRNLVEIDVLDVEKLNQKLKEDGMFFDGGYLIQNE